MSILTVLKKFFYEENIKYKENKRLYIEDLNQITGEYSEVSFLQ